MTGDHMAATIPGGKIKKAAASTKRKDDFIYFFNMGISGTPEILTHISSADCSVYIGHNWDKFNFTQKKLTN
jgi:hypothetical protein